MATPLESISSSIQRLKTTMLKTLSAPSSQEKSIATIPQVMQGFLTGPQKVLLWVTEMQQQFTIEQTLRQLVTQLWKSKEQTLPLFIELNQLARPLTHLLSESLQHYGLTGLEAQELIAARPPIILILLHYEKLKFKKPKNLYLENKLELYPIKKMIITCEASYLVPFQGNYAINFMSYREREMEEKLFMEIKTTTPVAELKQEEVVSEDYWGKLLSEDLSSLFPKGVPSLDFFKQHSLNQRSIGDNQSELAARAERCIKDHEYKKTLFLFLVYSKKNGEIAAGAANAISILNASKICFSGMMLKDIRVPYANLRFGIFDYTYFNNADLSNSDFTGAWLRNANFSQANMLDVKFGELPSIKLSEPAYARYSKDCQWLAIAAGLNIYLLEAASNSLVHTFKGHTEQILCIDFRADGLQLATGSRDKTVRLWGIEKRELSHTFTAHTDWVMSVAYRDDGLQFATGSKDQTICIWNSLEKKLFHTFEGHVYAVASLAYSPDGNKLASGGLDGNLCLWDVQEKKFLCRFKGHTDGIMSIAFGMGGRQLASGSWDKTVRHWDVINQKLLFTFVGHTEYVESLAFREDGLQIASGGDDNVIRIWDVNERKQLYCLEGHQAWITSISYFGDSQRLVSGDNLGYVRFWELQEYKAILKGHSEPITSVSFCCDGQQLASSSWDRTICIWSVREGRLLRTFDGHMREINSLAYNEKLQLLLSGGADQTVRLWGMGSKKDFKRTFYFGEFEKDLSKQHESSLWHSRSNNYIISIFDKDISKSPIILPKRVHGGDGLDGLKFNSVAYSPKGLQFAAGTDSGHVVLWVDDHKKHKQYILGRHNEPVTSVAFSSNSQYLVSASKDKTMRLWDTGTQKLIYSCGEQTNPIYTVIFRDDCQQLAFGDEEGVIHLWNIEERKLEHALIGHETVVRSLVYSDNGSQLASGSDDNTLRFWDLTSGVCLTIIRGFLNSVRSIAWAKVNHNEYLATGSEDKAVRLWRIERKTEKLRLLLIWASYQNRLVAENACFHGVAINEQNWELLKQRDAKGIYLTLKRNEVLQKPIKAKSCLFFSDYRTRSSEISQASDEFQLLPDALIPHEPTETIQIDERNDLDIKRIIIELKSIKFSYDKKMILRGLNVYCCEQLKTLLYQSCEEGNIEKVSKVLSYLGDDQLKFEYLLMDDEFGATPLFIAASKGHVEMVKLLLAKLSNKQRYIYVALAKNNGSTPMHAAAYYDHASIVTALLCGLNHKQRINTILATEKSGIIPIQTATICGNTTTYQTLLEALPLPMSELEDLEYLENRLKEQEFVDIFEFCEEKLASAYGKNAVILHFYGIALYKTQQLEPALIYLRQANQLSPENPEILDDLAFVTGLMERYHESLAYLDRILYLDHNNPTAFWKKQRLRKKINLQEGFATSDLSIIRQPKLSN